MRPATFSASQAQVRSSSLCMQLSYKRVTALHAQHINVMSQERFMPCANVRIGHSSFTQHLGCLDLFCGAGACGASPHSCHSFS